MLMMLKFNKYQVASGHKSLIVMIFIKVAIDKAL
jgi:hypothetical protein